MSVVSRPLVYRVVSGILGLIALTVALLPHEISVQGRPYQCGPVMMGMVPSDPASDRDYSALDPCHEELRPYSVVAVAVLLAGGTLALAGRAR